VGFDWSRFKGFWAAEEIPRWIGLSLVGILLFGLGALAYLNVQETQARLTYEARRQHLSSMDLLVTTLAGIRPSDTAAHQRVLRSYAYGHACETLRVVNGNGRIIASLSVDEVGQPRPSDPELGDGHPDRRDWRRLPKAHGTIGRAVFRIPIPNLSGDNGDPTAARRYVEGILLRPYNSTVSMTTISNGIVALMVIGMFFLLYRAMRRHFRSMALISENLMNRGDRIKSDLQELRLSDTQSALAVQWNRLIDLIDDLSTAEKRSTASTELMLALEKSKRGELADVVDILPYGVLHLGGHGTVSYANPVAQCLMGLTLEPGEFVSLDAAELTPTGSLTRDVVRNAFNADSATSGYSLSTESVDADDGSTTYRVRVLPFNKRERRGECVVLIADISQQVRAEQSAGEFVSQVTHELRTPLTNIRAYAETLSSGVVDDPKAVAECYNVITKETRRLGRLIEDVLSMSQLEVGSIQLQINDVDLRALLGDSVRDLRGLADEKEIDMQVALPSKLPVIQGDRDKLAVVVNNLLGNALKYSHAGGTVRVGCQITAEEVLISIKDNGIGIDPADHERIFQKFQRGSAAEVAQIEGSGIGLTTAREIARQHGGDIEVMSEVGQGAAFIVHLPLIEASGALGRGTGPKQEESACPES
jgi:signal transduction histidine kinase